VGVAVVEGLLRIAASLYLVGGLGFAFPALYASMALASSGYNPVIAGWVGFLLLNMSLCFLAGYAFFAWKWWGRPLAIGHNVFWLGLFLSGPMLEILSGRAPGLGDMPLPGRILSIAILSIPLGTILLCFQGKVKRLMFH
jgi:hypothetical protein